MRPALKRVLKVAAFPVFHLTVFTLFAVATFPFERLKERLVAEFNARQPAGSGTRIAIEDLSGYWLSGIEAKGVTLTTPRPAAEDGKPQDPTVVTLEHVYARVSILRMMFGTTAVSFGAKAFGGEISGKTSDARGDRTVNLELEGVDVSGLPLLAAAVGLPMQGSLTGTVDLILPEQKLSKAEGKIELSITELTIGDGKAKVQNTIALPRLSAGDFELSAEAEDGRLKIAKFGTQGQDIVVASDGSIRLREPFDQSVAELTLRFQFTDAYKNKNDITRGLFGAPGSTMPGLFDLDGKNRRAKRPDGFYAWRVTGPLAQLDAQPAPLGSTGAAESLRGSRGFIR
ncbi:MAG: type II secretion system protein GspN [Polyangiaceae bacterium]|nr:type II secretion system protein GspN [Polyangiaceae bacterium]